MINADAFDTDKDGYPEVVLQSGFSTTPAKGDGVMTLLTKGADVNAPWTAKEFDRMPSVHRVRWIDAEGNGRKMVVNGPLGGVARRAARLQGQGQRSTPTRCRSEAADDHRCR